MDLYVILGVQHGASESEIKRAYRRLARRFHPDINPGDREAADRFRQILEAYETLTDPDRRSRYDSGAPVGGQAPATGFEGFDFSVRPGERVGEQGATFGDLFAEVLAERGAPRQGSPERGADLHVEVAMPFDDSLRGGVFTIPVTRRESCGACAGSGRSAAPTAACVACQGSGTTRAARGHMVFSQRCRACGGTGRQRPRPCGACGGAGHETRAEAVQVRIPPGIADGDRVRVPAKGNAGTGGAPPGDLYVRVQVEAHERFRREGDDLHLVLPVAIHEAALGARIEVPTPDGPARMKIPPGTQSGQRFRLRERGASSARGAGRGDLVVEVRLMLPPVLDERSKELLREFGRINGENVRERP